MSQIQRFGLAGVGPSGPLLTLTGDSGGAVSPTGGNISILSENNPAIIPLGPPEFGFAEVVGDPGSSTLLLAPLIVTVITADATPTIITDLLIPTETSAVMTANVIGVNDDFSATCGGIITVIGRNDGSGTVVTSSGLIVTDYIGNPPPQVIKGTNGNRLAIFVVGIAGQTWSWSAQITYIFNVA